MTRELFALYLTFSTPTGVEERFVMGLENCDNLQPIVEQEFRRLNINRDKLQQSGYMCILWENHIIRQKLRGKDVSPQPKSNPCIIPTERSK